MHGQMFTYAATAAYSVAKAVTLGLTTVSDEA